MRDPGDRVDIRHIQGRIADGLHIDGAGFGRDGRLHALQIRHLDKAGGDAELGQDGVEHGEGAAVQVVGGHNFVTLPGQIDDGRKYGRRARGRSQRAHAAFQQVDPLFQHGLGRVAKAGVDIARLFKIEQSRGVFRAFEHVRRGAVQRRPARKGDRIGRLPAVHGECFKTGFHAGLLRAWFVPCSILA